MLSPMPPAPDVSVIVVTRNVRDRVLRCLESVEEHRGDLAVQALVVDNGSTDGTLESLAERFPAAEVVALGRNEGGVARNHALRRARGRYRMFIDSDAWVTEDAMQRMIARLESDPEIGMVGPRLVYPDGRLQLSSRRFPPRLLPVLRRPPLARWFEDGRTVRWHLMADDPHEHPREVEYVIGACAMFTEEAQRRAGEFDAKRFFFPMEDVDYCLALRTGGLRIVYEPSAVVVHDYQRSSAARPFTRGAARHLKEFVALQLKWRSARPRLIAEGREMDRRARDAPLAPLGDPLPR
jgi:N-acetylglucosaminyl-diphospho-decaprenol L-rhamnosyltransferase